MYAAINRNDLSLVAVTGFDHKPTANGREFLFSGTIDGRRPLKIRWRCIHRHELRNLCGISLGGTRAVGAAGVAIEWPQSQLSHKRN